MHKKWFILGAVGIGLLSGCAGLAKLQMKKATLSSGQKVQIGPVKPEANWGCKQTGWKSYNWEIIKFKSLGMGHSMLQKKAVAYANRKHISANYIYLKIPDQVNIMGINATMMADANIFYYKCTSINPDGKLGGSRTMSFG